VVDVTHQALHVPLLVVHGGLSPKYEIRSAPVPRLPATLTNVREWSCLEVIRVHQLNAPASGADQRHFEIDSDCPKYSYDAHTSGWFHIAVLA
jgi:hypothetical protein